MSDVVTRIILQDQASNRLNAINSTARSTASQLQQVGRQMDNAFRTNAPDQFASRLGNAVSQANAQVDSLGDSIDRALDGLDGGSTSSLGNSFTSAATGAQDLSRAVDDAGRGVDDLADSADELGRNLDDVGGDGLGEVADDAQEAGRELENTSGKASKLKGLLAGIAAAVSIAAIGHQIGGFVSDSVQVGQQFSATMSEVQAISGSTGAELEQLTDTARQYGATTIFSASQAGEALKYMALAGWDANQSSSALGGVLNLAAASGMELGQASDMVTDYLSAFGMAADQAGYFADMLTYAQGHSNTSTMQLGQAFLNSAAMLNSAGQDVETTTALLEAMANQGTKGTRAGTQLAAMMRDITNNMEDGSIMIGDTAVAVQDAEGNFRDLTDILFDVEGAVDGLGTADRAAALAMTFTADSTRGVNQILTEGMDKIAGYEEQLRSSAGTAEMAADVMNDNLKGDLANMNSAFEEMQIQVYEGMEQPLRNVVQTATKEFIPALTEFVPAALGGITNTVGKFADAMAPLITTVLRNPQAVGSAFTAIGAGMLAFKGVGVASNIATAVSGTGELSGALGKLWTIIKGNPWAIGAASVAAAAVTLHSAMEAVSDAQINASLTAHFGTVEMDDSQIDEFANRVIDGEYIVNVTAALGHFENADKLAQDAEDALAQNDTLEWKCRVGLELTPDEQSVYTNNMETFADSKVKELEERTYAAQLSIQTILTSPEGESLGAQISEWASQDMADVTLLQGQITNLVQSALEDGIIDVNEQAAIDILQNKINAILTGWKSSEAQAEMDLIEQQYGRLSGKDLSADTFMEIVNALGEQRESAAEALEADSKEFYGVINGLVNSGRLTEGQGEDYKEQFVEAVRNREAGSLLNSLNFEGNTLSDTYGDLLNQNYETMQTDTTDFLDRANSLLADNRIEDLFNEMQFANGNSMIETGFFSSGDQKALADLYETMAPDVDAMSALIDEYRTMGQAVPEEIMTAFNDAISIGAAAGDSDAAWQQFANQLVADPASQALEQAILDGTLNVPEELSTAIQRATAETTSEPVTVDSLTAELQNVEVDEQKVQELLDKSLEGLEATGQTTTVDGGELAIEYTVQQGNTLSEIAAQNNLNLEQILADNPEITNPNVIEVGQVIKIRASEVDASEVGPAIEQSTQDTTAGTDTQAEVPADVTITPGTVDASQAAAGAQDAADETFATPLETPGTANITLTQTNNADAIYSEVGSQLISRFATGFSVPATAHVSVTMDYSIANPTSTVTVGGAGSGSGTLTASIAGHAEGGYFDQPHLAMVAEGGYGEWIIPNDGSDDSRAMAMDALNALGATGEQGSTLAPINAPTGRDEATTGTGAERTINVNVNGSGAIQVSGGSGVSKEQIVEIMLENMREVFMNIVQQEIIEEGDGVYEF